MEPLSIAVIAGAVGGAAGKLVEKAWDCGAQWLSDYFRHHLPEAQEAARSNALDFLADLAKRVREIEEAAADSARVQQQIEDALNDPAFSHTLQKALLTSSTTASSDKHQILARIVSERLLAEPEGLVALTTGLACDAVGNLTARQLDFLGLAVLIFGIRPTEALRITPDVIRGERYAAWLEQYVSLHLPVESLRYIEYAHLEALSCLRYEPIIGRALKTTLGNIPALDTQIEWPFDAFVESAAGRRVAELWEQGMKSITLTTVGDIVGITVHNIKARVTTTMNW